MAVAAHQPAPGDVVTVNLAHVIDTPPPTRGHAKPRVGRTGIDKRPAAGPVAVHRLGLVGDTICDTPTHGGEHQAVYAYAEEDTAWWQQKLAGELRMTLGPGSLGENLTTRGVDVTGAVIGERWRIGSTVLQVTSPRLPCSTFAAYWAVDYLVRRFTEEGRPGAYLRVLTEGEVRAGDPITVVDRPAHGLTVQQTFRALTGDRTLAPRLLEAPELPSHLQVRAARLMAVSAR